jgi:beta-galactosidase/beta-glucuronidase
MRLVVVLAASVALYAQRLELPRPDFERAPWMTLNGKWDFGFDEKFGRSITVPFCWESELSGIAKKGETTGWYRKTFVIPASWSGKHAWLHFDGVDEEAHVWANGKDLGTHHGGYSPFEFDLNSVAQPGDSVTVIVRAFDPTDQELPVGKQTPGWYTYVSGIWQTVLEYFIKSFNLTPRRDGDRWFVDVDAVPGGTGQITVDGTSRSDSPTKIRVEGPGIKPTDIELKMGKWSSSIAVESPKLWTPDSPKLYDITLNLGKDRVKTHFDCARFRAGSLAVFLTSRFS